MHSELRCLIKEGGHPIGDRLYYLQDFNGMVYFEKNVENCIL